MSHMSHSRTRLSLEALEARENPATLFSESFDTLTPPALPAGWATWTSDGTTAFTTANAVGAGGTKGLVASAGSRTAALAWHPQTVTGDTGAAVALRADSLVPMFVFARGNDLGTANRSYLAAVVTRGLSVQLLEVNGTSVRALGTVNSPSSAYLSGKWVNVSLVPTGTTVKVEVTRADTGQYLNSAGSWQAAKTTAITATTTLNPAQGQIGVGRSGVYAGAVVLDDFSAVTDPPVPPPVVGITQSFDTTAVGTAPTGWASWSSDSTSFKVASTRALSPAHSFASTGASNTITRSWANTDLPADVDASAALFVDSLIPGQVFVRGSNLQGATPTYYAVNVTRGLQANLVKVVNGVETTIGSIRSTPSVYVSGQWVRTRLLVEGDRLRVQLYRPDTRQWLTPDGQWSDSPDFALEVRDSSITGGGKAGVGRKAGAAGALTVDDFEAKPAGAASGPQVAITRVNGTGNVTGEVTFRATVTGSFNRVEFRLDNIVRAISATSPAEWTFDSTTVVNGDYTLTVRAFDAAGNVTSKDFAFTVGNPNRDPLPDPVIPRHYSHIRIAQLAYTGIPITGAFEQSLLRNSVDLVIPNPQYLGAINTTAPNATLKLRPPRAADVTSTGAPPGAVW